MKKLVPVFALALAAQVGHAHADQLTCDTLTITAPAGVRILVGYDAEPPVSISDGQTAVLPLDGMHAEHYYVATSFDMETGARLDAVIGHVDGCTFTPPDTTPIVVPGYGSGTVPSVAVAEPPVPVVTASASFVPHVSERLVRFGVS